MKNLWRFLLILLVALFGVLAFYDPIPAFAQSRLSVTSLCSSEPAQTRNWRITNNDSGRVNYRWHLLNSEQRGSGMLNQGESTVLTTATIAGSNTLRVRAAGPDVQVTSSGEDCDPAALPTQPPSVPTQDSTAPTSSPPAGEPGNLPSDPATGNDQAQTSGNVSGNSAVQGVVNPAAQAACGSPDCSEIAVTAVCYEGNALFVIENRGATGSGDMSQWASWRVYVNDTVMDAGSYLLAGGQSGQVTYPADGQLVRLEADQQPWNQPAIVSSAPIRCGVSAPVVLAQGAEKVWVCHSTGSRSNPFVAIRVSVNATRNGHVQFDSDGTARTIERHHGDRILPDVPLTLTRRQVEDQYCAADVIDATATPTATASSTATPIATATFTHTATSTQTATATSTQTATVTPTATATYTFTATPTATATTQTATSTQTPTATATTQTATSTQTPTATATLTPSPTDDSCDLRVEAGDVAGLASAITLANVDPGLTIICLTDSTYALAGTLLPVLSSQIEMQGAGAQLTTSGEQIFRINAQVSLLDMTLSGGTAANGGAIYNLGGDLTLDGVTLSGGSAARGGAVYNDNALLTIQNSTFSSNSASELGGAIYSFGSSSVTISSSTFDGNSAGAAGGAIANYDGTLTVNGSTFSNQNAQNGGAIYNNILGNFYVQGSVFENNSATFFGAALSSDGTNGQLTDSCVVGNTSAVGDVANFGASALDATGNWWGAADGPGGSAPGSGDTIYGNVSYLPFSTVPLPICGG